jgi:hypothetical protein
MAAIKLTTSGKAIHFIDDEGRVFQTSLYDYSLLVAGKKKFITPVLLPHGVSPKRFPPSPLYNIATQEKVDVGYNFKSGGHDAYDIKKFNESKEKKIVERSDW